MARLCGNLTLILTRYDVVAWTLRIRDDAAYWCRSAPIWLVLFILGSCGENKDTEVRELCRQQEQAFSTCDALGPDVSDEEFYRSCVESVAEIKKHGPEPCIQATLDWIACTRDAMENECNLASGIRCGDALENCAE